MLRNYLKIAFRQLWRNKSFSAINLFGLTLGTACCLYILLYVQHHRSYDRHHAGVENLYRIISDLNLSDDGETMHMATCSPPIAPAMQEDFPEVELAARVCSHPA
ncbi:MAG: ABC transporter permease, partial [Saprospiraceae bacterium]|nr:ABC transporter permease [Saprospiraceae bacterium]